MLAPEAIETLVIVALSAVFRKAAVADVELRLTVIAPPTVVVLPKGSRRSTVIVPETPADLRVCGAVVMTSCVAVPATTVKVALVPAASASPPVRVAVRLTPDSAFVYVTPSTIAVVTPASICPLNVPPKLPVPDALLRLNCVAEVTGLGLPPRSVDCTVTLKPTPAVGLVPPFTDVTASLAAGPVSTVKSALVPALSELPLVRVAVIDTPGSAFVYVTLLTTIWFVPLAIVPVRVPPRVPVPVARESVNPVAAVTFAGLPFASWLWTVTVKGAPPVGLTPPLIEMIASLAGVPAEMLNALLVAPVRLPDDATRV